MSNTDKTQPTDLSTGNRTPAELEAWWAAQCKNAMDETERLKAAVAAVEREIRFAAYANAGDTKRMDDMKMFSIWAGRLQKAITNG